MRRFFGTPWVEYLAPVLLWLATLSLLAVSLTYRPETWEMPLVVASALLVLVSLDFLSRTRTPLGELLIRYLNPAAQAVVPNGDHPALRDEMKAIVLVLAFVAMVLLIGVLLAVPLFVFASVWFKGKHPFMLSCLTAAGTTLFLWLLFPVLLRTPLFPGFLFGGDW